MLNNWSFILAVTVMAVATFATRVGGAVLMSHIKPTAKTERFLEGLSISVISAIGASQLMSADVRNITAVVIAVLVMLVTRNVVWAMFTGMIAAAAFPFVITI